MKLASCCAKLCLVPLLLAGIKPAQSAPVKLTGWFTCDKCTASRVAKGDVRPSNPVCAKKCIEDGSEVVFLSEQGKESLKVRNYASPKEDLGYHLEVTGEVDPTVKTISILSVKRLPMKERRVLDHRGAPRNERTGAGPGPATLDRE